MKTVSSARNRVQKEIVLSGQEPDPIQPSDRPIPFPVEYDKNPNLFRCGREQSTSRASMMMSITPIFFRGASLVSQFALPTASLVFYDHLVLDARLANDTITALLEEQIGNKEAQQAKQCHNLDRHASCWWC